MILVIPLAGRGSRLASEYSTRPKPLIEIEGRLMIEWALLGLRNVPRRKTVFVALEEHDRQFHITSTIQSIAGSESEFVLLSEVTEGQLCTVLAAKQFFQDNEDILIAACDTLVMSQIDKDIRERPADCAGIISVCDMPGDRWSFARTDETGSVIEVTEKVRISSNASTGLYYFAQTNELVNIADQMLATKETTRGEYYVMPVYQKLIDSGRKVLLSQASGMWDMGNPESIKLFQENLSRLGSIEAIRQ